MKDKYCNKCKKKKIDSKRNKSSLCAKCSQKKWNKEHEEEVKVYRGKYIREYYKEKKAEVDRINKKYYLSHKKEMDEYRNKYYYENIERCKKLTKKNYEKNKELRKKQNLENYHRRYRKDEGFRMRRLLGTALGHVIRHYIKTGKITNPMRKYHIDWKGIMKVLTPIPQPRKDYHVDHIIPLWKFDLTNFEQIHIAFAPENHRWMLAEENMKRSKSKKIK